MHNKAYDSYLQELLNHIKDSDQVFSKDIPNIDLYMDQVTTFMDDHLGVLKRNEEGKMLTKTMINNYSKCQLLPPTNKKKYSRNHMLLLLLIYSLKPTLSIPDIQSLLEPLKNITLKDDTEIPLEKFYDTLVTEQFKHYDNFAEEVTETIDISKHIFTDVPSNDKETLAIITTAYLLSMQASMQKYLATQLIDTYLKPEEETKETKKDVKVDENKNDKTKKKNS